MNGIGWAVKAMQDGKRVRREAWGSGTWIVLQKGYPQGIPINANTAEATGIAVGTVCSFAPYVMMHTCVTSAGAFVPWVCSQMDLLAIDWEEAPSATRHDAKA